MAAILVLILVILCFRYGIYSFKSEPVKRMVRFTNTSTIPFKIVWHIINKKKEKGKLHDNVEPSPYNPPFSLLLDVFGLKDYVGEDETNCVLKIVRYFGTENPRTKRSVFKVRI